MLIAGNKILHPEKGADLEKKAKEKNSL